MYKCEECGKEYESLYSYRSHTACHSPKYKLSQKNRKRLEQVVVERTCVKCGEIFTVIRTINKNGTQNIHKYESKCCSHGCANSILVLTKEQNKSKGRSGPKNNRWVEPENRLRNRKDYRCRICGNPIRKKKHGLCVVCYKTSPEMKSIRSIAGLNSAASRKNRSKNEQLFCEMCESHFSIVKHNEPMFNGWDADVIVEDVKTAVLWNGRWHYLQITKCQHLNQIQNRDKIKIGEIEKAGYRPYVIKDLGRFNPKFVKEEFDKFISIFQGVDILALSSAG